MILMRKLEFSSAAFSCATVSICNVEIIVQWELSSQKGSDGEQDDEMQFLMKVNQIINIYDGGFYSDPLLSWISFSCMQWDAANVFISLPESGLTRVPIVGL